MYPEFEYNFLKRYSARELNHKCEELQMWRVKLNLPAESKNKNADHCDADLVLILCDDQVVEVDVCGEEEPAGVVVDEGVDQLENLVCWKKVEKSVFKLL